MENWKRFESLTEILGEKIMLNEIKNWMSEDMLGELCDDISRNYDLTIEDDEDYE